MKVHLLTLGCKVNQHESQQATDQLVGQGHCVVSDVVLADIVIVNTCTVTQVADKKSRQLIRQVARKNPNAEIIITGCMTENPATPIVVLEGSKVVLKNELETFLSSLPSTDNQANAPRVSGRVRRTLLVQTGCDYFCSYCINPTVRHGRLSFSRHQVLADFQKLVKAGVKEIVLTGINLATWHDDGLDFAGLIMELLKTHGDYRIRLGSLEPNLVTRKLLTLMDTESRLAPHLHVPLQGATDDLLKQMRRRYSISDYRGLLKNIRALSRRVSITTDLIVGFPTETEEDGQTALDLINEDLFLDVHAFSYSPRKGTDAAQMAQISATIVGERMGRVLSAIALAKKRLLTSFQGQAARVLVESIQNEQPAGYTEGYIKVELSAKNLQLNQFIDVILDKPTLMGKDWGMRALA